MAAPAISKGMFATDVDGNVWMKALRLIRRSRVLHMVFWGYSWYALVHMLQQHSPERSLTVIHHSSTATILFQMMMVYTIVYGLLPRYFARGQLVRFVLTALLAVLVFSVAVVYVKELWMRLVVDPGYTLNHKMVIMSNLMDSVVLTFIWTVIYVAEHLFLKDRHHARMEQQRLRTELDHLKAQLNPHFLFNTLNSIHVIMRHDVKRAERSLMEFSGLLRYQLYECDGPSTTLEKEVEFLRNYIALERMRHGDELELVFDAPAVIPYQQMAPFVLIVLVENAFKHVSRSTRQRNRIAIDLRCANGRVELKVVNTCGPRTEHGGRRGIGLENVRRRLELLYPQRHRLELMAHEQLFTAHLILDP